MRIVYLMGFEQDRTFCIWESQELLIRCIQFIIHWHYVCEGESMGKNYIFKRNESTHVFFELTLADDVCWSLNLVPTHVDLAA